VFLGAVLIIGMLFEVVTLTDIASIFALLIAVIAFYYSKIVEGAEVMVMKDDVEATFFLINNDDMYRGGSLRFSLVFYNRGDRMSVLKIKEIDICDQPLESVKMIRDNNISIPPTSHHLYEPSDIYFKSTDSQPPSSISFIRIKFTWTKKDNIKEENIKIPIICDIV
jgi:hypothetical protein